MNLKLALLATLFVVACAPEDKSGGPGGGGVSADAGGAFASDGGGGGRDGGGGRGNAQPGEPCEFTDECAPIATCYEGVCVGDGSLRFSMSWVTDTDIDLHVVTPAGNEIYYDDPIHDGGELDVDDCILGICRVQSGTHVENVVFTGSVARGTYVFWAHNYDGDVDTSVTLDAFADGIPTTYTAIIPRGGAGEGVHHSLSY